MKITLIGGETWETSLQSFNFSWPSPIIKMGVTIKRELNPEGINIVNKIDQDEKCDIYLIAVSDNSIKK